MRIRTEPKRPLPSDVGTLWTMRQGQSLARCALFAWPAHWEVRVIVDGQTVRSEDCRRGAEGFTVAEHLRGRMLEEGWTQVIPVLHRQSVVRRPGPALTLVPRQA